MAKILIVDDEPDILELIRYNLEKEGYKVFLASNGLDGIAKAKEVIPDLIILDLMMPGMDGIEACTELRKIPDLQNPLIAFLTARNEDFAQIGGFEAGADDFINKPIKPKVLLSRIKGLLRRKFSETENGLLVLGELSIDKEKYIIIHRNVEINLPRKEFELLALLSSKPGKVFSRDEILNNVWGGDVVVGDRTIDVHVRKIREKIGDNYIKTIKGVGYKFEF
jgi:two-component system, OmpR family, alkaline phosphatase synthesis response regulator PhoP